MIESIAIKGFQSHTDSLVDLGPGLNVITGPSDSGKTALIRAVKWVAFNEPQGEAFVNEAVGEAEVTITLENGVSITKRRRKGKTSYKISTIDEPFEKSEVPEEVAQALGIKKQTFGDFVTALNFAFQLEAPFLISETASAGAKILGKLAGTEAVDLAIKGVSKDTYAARQDKIQAEKEITKIEVQLGGFYNLGDIREGLEACDYLLQKVDEAEAKRGRLVQLQVAHEQHTATIAVRNMRLEHLAPVILVEPLLQGVEKSQQRREALLALSQQLRSFTVLRDTADAKLALLEDIAPLGDQLQAVEVNSQRVAALTSLSTRYETYTQAHERAHSVIQRMAGLEEAESLLEGIRKANERATLLNKQGAEYHNTIHFLAHIDGKLAQLEGIAEAEALIQQAEATQKRIQDLQLLQKRYDIDTKTAEKATALFKGWEDGIQLYNRELEKLWQEAGGVCPLCDQIIQGGSNHGH